MPYRLPILIWLIILGMAGGCAYNRFERDQRHRVPNPSGKINGLNRLAIDFLQP